MDRTTGSYSRHGEKYNAAKVKTYRVIPTRRSDRDLVEIARYVSQDSSQIAVRLIDDILAQIDLLKRLPERFVQVGVSRKKRMPVHRLIVHSYLVYYRVEAEVVYILTVRHASRRPLKRFD